MELNELLEQIDRLKTEIDNLRPIDSDQERRILQKSRLDWTFHSNSIEGNKLTYGETKAFLLHGITAQGKPFRDYLDIKGHHQAIDYLLELIRRQKPLAEADVRELHKVILVEPYDVDAKTPDGYFTKRRIQPGQYKTMPNHVETSTGEIHYYATPEETPAKMSDLMAWYRRELDKGNLHPLILAATFHYQFVAIHPFDDGNGRMARLLMNLILMQAGFPPVIIHTEDKNNYLLALEQADSGDLQPFIYLIGDELLRSLDLFLRGAKGQTIDEIGDIDKKLALLEKKIDSHKELKERQSIYRKEKEERFLTHILRPFLSQLLFKFAKFNRFFEEYALVSSEGSRDLNFSVNDLEPLLQQISRFMGKITPLQIRYQWNKFATDKKYGLWCTLDIVAGNDEFIIGYQLNSEFNVLFQGQYDEIYSTDELSQYAVDLANKVYEILAEKN